MPIFVPLKEGSDAVTVSVTIAGTVFWHFIYAADDKEVAKSGTSENVEPFELGQPDKLNRDINTWHFALMNPMKKGADFSIRIEWKQGDETIAKWPEKAAKKGTLKAGENTVVDDSGFFAVVPAKEDE
jgi:hypothetical protein